MSQDEYMKETGQRACHINAVGCATALKARPALADTWWTKGRAVTWHNLETQPGHMANTWRKKFGGAAKADSRQTQGRTQLRRTQGGHGGQALEPRPKRTQGGHMADTWRTKAKADTLQTRFGGHNGHAEKVWRRGHRGLKGHKADTRRTQGGHKADTRRTRGGHMADTSGQAPGRGLAASPFFLREIPTVNCLGKTVWGLRC